MKKNDSKELKLKVSHLPKKPGVYLFKNKAGSIIYVGKAKVLRNRVRSYFGSRAAADSLKVQRMVAKITDLETIVTDSEVEALILEANLVKEYRPQYNINLRDDKSFPYIRVTEEAFPRIFPTRAACPPQAQRARSPATGSWGSTVTATPPGWPASSHSRTLRRR